MLLTSKSYLILAADTNLYLININNDFSMTQLKMDGNIYSIIEI